MLKKNFNFIFQEPTSERLDHFLSKQTGLTRSLIQKNIKNGAVRVNAQIAPKTGLPLQTGDQITAELELLPDLNEDLKPEAIDLKVVFEDEHLLVIDKPAGLIVHPAGYLREGTLVNALLHKYQNGLSNLGNAFRPGIVHRLDKDTSGLMVIAKTNEAHLSLSEQLATRSLSRVYWAVAMGRFKEAAGTIEGAIGRHPVDRKKMAVIKNETKKARSARTHWKLLEEFKDASLLEIKLETGRTHQIRVHFEHIGHPLLGDPLYGGKRSQSKLLNRQCLHAKKIAFVHPIFKNFIELESELPEDFKQVLQKLR